MDQIDMVLSSVWAMWAFIAWLATALFAGYVAGAKERCGFCWFIWGLLFGPVALVAAVGMPDLTLQRLVYEMAITQRAGVPLVSDGVVVPVPPLNRFQRAQMTHRNSSAIILGIVVIVIIVVVIMRYHAGGFGS